MEVSVTRGRLNGTSPKCGTAWDKKTLSNLETRLKAWTSRSPQKKCVRICLSDLLGQTHTDILLWLRRYGQPFVAHSWVASGWLYLSQFRFQQGTEGASGKGGCAVRKIIRTSIVKPSVWCGYADFLSAMPPVPMTDPYHVRVNHQHGFTCAKKNDKKRKRQDPVKVPLSHSHERACPLADCLNESLGFKSGHSFRICHSREVVVWTCFSQRLSDANTHFYGRTVTNKSRNRAQNAEKRVILWRTRIKSAPLQ